MERICRIYLILIFIITNYFVSGQCAITLAPSTTNSTCVGCNNGTASVSVSGGTAPYTYVWTNNVTAGTATLAASKDNSIYEQTTGNSNGAGQNFVAGETNAGFKNRTLIAFDIAGNIPAGAAIISANLKINMLFTSGASGPQTQSIHKLLQNWGEGTSVATQAGQGVPATTNDATWLKTFFPASDWTTAGGTFNATASAATIVDQQAIYTWSSATMTADIQSWLNTPASNFGWLLKGDESGNRQAKRYGSRENVVPGNAPVLTVNYASTVIGNTSSISNLSPGTYNITVTDINGCSATSIVTIGVVPVMTSVAFILDITTYRGAFAPAPETQWTEGWINWDPQNAAYPATTATVTRIVNDTTWTTGSVIKISGFVYVGALNAGKTLTIQPGVIIRGDETAVGGSALFVPKGAKIYAIGTPCNPIVFTSNKNIGARAKGDWGGLLLLGNAKNNLGTNVQIEGTPAGEPRNFHGGGNDDDNSGTLKYVRIEFGGIAFAPNNEINGLTMGSVGRGTTIDYVQVSFNDDDAFEWFGGTVNCRHLVAYRNLDDDWDTDNGFSGIVQYGLSVKDPSIADNPQLPSPNSTSEGFESDNDANSSGNLPKTTARFYNITQIGGFRCANNGGPWVVPTDVNWGFRRAARIRRNSELKIYNSILMNNWRGLFIDGAPTIATGGYGFQNNILAQDTTTVWATGNYNSIGRVGEDQFSKDYVYNPVNNITVLGPANGCNLLTNAWTFPTPTFPNPPDFRPNPGFVSNPASSGASGGTDLSPLIEIDNFSFIANQGRDFIVDIFEISGTGSSAGIITITVPKPSGWTITVPGITLTGTNQSGVNGNSAVNGGTTNANGNWLFREDANNVYATSKAGISIASGDLTVLGFRATRKAGTSTGTNQNLGANLGGGGDAAASNNGAIAPLTAN